MHAARANHQLPEGLRPRLDLRVPPEAAWPATNYREILALLERLGAMIDAGAVADTQLRRWENEVAALLHGDEIGHLMAPRPGDGDFPDRASLPGQRWENLREILMSRKGLWSR